MPVGAPNFAEALRYGAETFHALKGILHKRNYATSVGDEGGFAPNLKSNDEACEVIIEAIKAAGYVPGKDIAIALDPAASSFYEDGAYNLSKSGQGKKTSAQMTAFYKAWVEKYPIVSIEDGLAENDWDGFREHTAALGDKIQIVGDDIFVTNTKFIARGIQGEDHQRRAHQAQPDRLGDRDHRGHRDVPQGGLGLRGVAPLGRDRGRLPGRLRRGHGRRPDQDRLGLPQRADRQVQPVAGDRGRTRQGRCVRKVGEPPIFDTASRSSFSNSIRVNAMRRQEPLPRGFRPGGERSPSGMNRGGMRRMVLTSPPPHSPIIGMKLRRWGSP